MAKNIREFLVSYGFAVDTAGMSRTESATKAAEDRVTAANAAALAKRIAAEKTAQTERIRTAIAAGEQLTAEDRRFVLEQENNRVAAADAERKRQQEATKQGRQQREDTLKEIRATALKVTGVVTGIAAAVQGAAGGILYATDRAAKAFERLNYAGQSSGTSANGINAFTYAISQLGGTADAAQASLQAFGSNLQKYEAFEGVLKSMGIVTRDTNGHLRDSSQLLTEYLQKLGAMPRAQREAVAGAWGIDESTIQAGIRPEMRSKIAEYNQDRAASGADPDSAAQGGTAFAQAMRHVNNLIDLIKTRIGDALFRIITPQLQAVADWLRDNGKTVSDVISALAGGLSRLEAALVSAIAGNGDFKDAVKVVTDALIHFGDYIGSDDFKKSVKAFASDVMALARAIRHGLELLGILPSSTTTSDRAAAAGADAVEANNMGVFGNAIVRGHKNWMGGRQDQTDEGKVRGRLDNFRKAGNYGVKGWWTPERQSHAVDKLMKEGGLSEDGAKALVSRWTYVESAGGPTAVNPHSGAEGIAQWLGSRKGGGSSGSFDEQLSKVAKELNGPEDRAKRLLNTPGQEATGASQFERAEGYNPATGRDNFTDRTAGGMAHIAHGAAPSTPPVAASDPAPAPSSAASASPSESDYKAAQARYDALMAPGHVMTAAEHDQLGKDNKVMDAYWASKGKAGPMPHVEEEYFGAKAGPEVKDGRKLGASSAADLAHKHHMNELIVRAAHHGMLHPYLHGKALGDTEALRRSVHKSIKGDTNVTHNPTVNIHTSDARAGMEAARLFADRGNRDLIRNVQGMEA